MTRILALVAMTASVVSAHRIVFSNTCPDPLALYTDAMTSPIATLKPYKGEFNVDSETGLSWYTYWTNLNGGGANGDSALKFVPRPPMEGFVPLESYFLSKPSSKHLGVGITIKPVLVSSPARSGDCSEVTCDSMYCETAFDKPEDAFNLKTIKPPFYTCSENHPLYRVTFCPNGKYASERDAREIHPGGDNHMCLDTKYSVGKTLAVKTCDGSDAQKWILDDGWTTIRNLEYSDACIARDYSGIVELASCDVDAPDAQAWSYYGGRIMPYDNDNTNSNDCLDFEEGFKISECKTSADQSKVYFQTFTI